MKTLSTINSITHSPVRYSLFLTALTVIVFAMGTPTANGAPGDLIVPELTTYGPAYDTGNILQVPINPPFGAPSFIWDNTSLPAHFWAGCAFDPQFGNLYMSDTGSAAIYKLTPDRTSLILFATCLNGPLGLAVDAAGNLYEADTGTGNIYKFTPQGSQSTFASGLNLHNGPYGMILIAPGTFSFLVPDRSLETPPQSTKSAHREVSVYMPFYHGLSSPLE